MLRVIRAKLFMFTLYTASLHPLNGSPPNNIYFLPVHGLRPRGIDITEHTLIIRIHFKVHVRFVASRIDN